MPYTSPEFLQRTGPILCLDIGSGTQDVLLARPGFSPENWARFVLPSPAQMLRQRILALTMLKKPIWLYGHNMGGGFALAVHEHIAKGLGIAITKTAAVALHDDLQHVIAMGVQIADTAPSGYVPVYMSDYSPAFWQGILQQSGLPLPHIVLAAAQDHGIHPDGNRAGRMQHWRELLATSPQPENWLYTQTPTQLTRLCALSNATGGPVADTGMAAIVGALCSTEVQERSQREGVTIVNVGNSHTLAALVYQNKVYGLYEHHTEMHSLEHLLKDLQQFRLGWLPDEQVRQDGGHGTAINDLPEAAAGFVPTFITGPQRSILCGHGVFIAPHGDMMLTGCYGLLRAFAAHYNQHA